MTLYDSSYLNVGNYTTSMTGVPVSGAIDPKTSTSFTPPKSLVKNTTTPVSKRSSNADKTVQTEVSPHSAAPYATPDTTQTTAIDQDSYRFGNFSGPTTGDNLKHARTLGAQEDTIASLSLTAEVTGEIIQNNLMNVSQQISQVTGNIAQSSAFTGSIISAYSRFMLQNVSESEQEKLQIVETFTAFYVFFYGKKPPVYRFSGMLLNDQNHKWTNDLKFFYENYFRGTRAVELSAQAVMSYDGTIVSGFLIDMSIGKSSELDKGAPFSFSMIVTDHTPAYFSADISALITSKQVELANQAAVIQRQLADINANVPSEQRILASQVRVNLRAPTSASIEGSKIAGSQAVSNQSASSQQFNSALK